MVEIFGSSVAYTTTFRSDVDLNLDLPTCRRKKCIPATLRAVRDMVGKISGMQKVELVFARVSVIIAEYHVKLSIKIMNR